MHGKIQEIFEKEKKENYSTDSITYYRISNNCVEWSWRQTLKKTM